MKEGKKILIAPLNWGLGHATRCIPIIKALIQNNLVPVVASDGSALTLLKKEFSGIESLELPTYNIHYGKYLRYSLFMQIPKILRTIQQERRVIDTYIQNDNQVCGIISDNRFGVHSAKVPSVYLTHQLNVLSGSTSWITTKIHHKIIENFDECWVPDQKDSLLSGTLSRSETVKVPVKFIGPLSRLQRKDQAQKNRLLVVLSGPEPNRTSLEHRLLHQLETYQGPVAFVRGVVEAEQKITHQRELTVYNYLLTEELEDQINRSYCVICRSGYSSVMDLAATGSRAFLIPTKGQNEQEYLASHLARLKIAPWASEEAFDIARLSEVNNYSGFDVAPTQLDSHLFDLFKGK